MTTGMQPAAIACGSRMPQPSLQPMCFHLSDAHWLQEYTVQNRTLWRAVLATVQGRLSHGDVPAGREAEHGVPQLVLKSKAARRVEQEARRLGKRHSWQHVTPIAGKPGHMWPRVT